VKKAALVSMILIIAIIVHFSALLTIKTVEAANVADYSIEHVNHTIEVMYNGYIFINDTIRIVGNASEGTQHLDRFLIGFPYKYSEYLLRCVAYDGSGVFNVALNVPLENRVGFYAVEVSFPQPLDISIGTTHVFTVGFLLSNNLLSVAEANIFIVDFPEHPSLTRPAANCSVSVFLSTREQEFDTYFKENLPAFSYSPKNLPFSATEDEIQMFDVHELKREVRINGQGEVEGSDAYRIENKAQELSSIQVILPPNASNPSAQDQFGHRMEELTLTDEEANRYELPFMLPLEAYRSIRFTVKYRLPSTYITQMGANNFNATFPLFPHINYYVESASVTFVPPEGARILSFETTLVGGAYSITRGVFHEAVTIDRRDISYPENFLPSENVLQVVYEYNPLWLSFRYTLWMWALAVVGLAVAVVWKRPEAPAMVAVPSVAVRLSPEYVKSFVNAYEEKRRIILEMESLESRVQKGKIPRRRYKVQRKTLETRLSTLSKNLTESKGKMRAAGGHYSDLMRQLEIAETEINEVEANIKSIEARHNRGELSLEAYRKLLADYQRRKERAETAINGILIRLREEIR